MKSVKCAYVFPETMVEGEAEMRGQTCGAEQDFWWHDDRADGYDIQHKFKPAEGIKLPLSPKERVQSWRDTCADYEQRHANAGNLKSAEFHRGCKEAFQRVLDEIVQSLCAKCGEPKDSISHGAGHGDDWTCEFQPIVQAKDRVEITPEQAARMVEFVRKNTGVTWRESMVLLGLKWAINGEGGYDG